MFKRAKEYKRKVLLDGVVRAAESRNERIDLEGTTHERTAEIKEATSLPDVLAEIAADYDLPDTSISNAHTVINKNIRTK